MKEVFFDFICYMISTKEFLLSLLNSPIQIFDLSIDIDILIKTTAFFLIITVVDLYIKHDNKACL